MRRVNSCLQKNKPKPNWRITRELAERELGYNNSFRQKFYGSLHAVERLELMHKMDEHKVIFLKISTFLNSIQFHL